MRIAETKRLFIDEAVADDAPFFQRLLNSPGWLMHIGDRNIKSKEDAEAYICDRLIKSYHDNGFGLYVMKLQTTGEPIGICGFVKRDYLPAADLGFAILPGYEENGYTYEAAETLIQHAFDQLSFPKISAITSLANEKSKQLLLKLGFSHEGSVQPDKNQPPVNLFSMLKS